MIMHSQESGRWATVAAKNPRIRNRSYRKQAICIDSSLKRYHCFGISGLRQKKGSSSPVESFGGGWVTGAVLDRQRNEQRW
jgi:hypothetical protein